MEVLLEEAIGNGIWTLLSVVLLIYTIKSADKREERMLESKTKMREQFDELTKANTQREKELMEHLKMTNQSHEKMANAMQKMEQRMDDGFNKVWARLRTMVKIGKVQQATIHGSQECMGG